jgi:hypothetical protein
VGRLQCNPGALQRAEARDPAGALRPTGYTQSPMCTQGPECFRGSEKTWGPKFSKEARVFPGFVGGPGNTRLTSPFV